MGYEDIYALKPEYEDVNNGGKGWYKLKWRPLWKKTFNIYFIKHHYWHFWTLRDRTMSLGIRIWDQSARNGWNRAYNSFHVEVGLLLGTLNFWIKWNYLVHKDGPSDMGYSRPLDLSGLE